MAVQLPDISLEPRQTPRPSKGIARMRTTTGFEGIPAQVQAQVGADISRLGEQVFQAKERQDTLVVEAAYNDLLAQKMELEYGDHGYRKVTEGNAIDPEFREKQIGRWSTTVSGIEQTLKNGNQKQKFNRRAEVEQLSFTEGLLRYSASEAIRLAKTTFDSAQQLALLNMAADGGRTYQSDMHRVINTMAETGVSAGYTKEQIEIGTQLFVDKSFTTLIEAAINDGDLDLAETFYTSAMEGETIGGKNYSISPMGQAGLQQLERAGTALVMQEINLQTSLMQKAVRAGVEDIEAIEMSIGELADSPFLNEQERTEVKADLHRFAFMEQQSVAALKNIHGGDTAGAMEELAKLRLLDLPEFVSVRQWDQHLDGIFGEISDLVSARRVVKKVQDEAVKIENATIHSDLITMAKKTGVSQSELQYFVQEGIITPDELIQIDQLSNKTRGEAADVVNVMRRLLGDSALVVTKKAVNEYYIANVADLDDSEKALYVDTVKMVPAQLKAEIDTGLLSGDPTLAAQASGLIDDIDQIPGLAEPFSPNNRAFADWVVKLSRSMDPQEAVKLARQLTDPRDSARIEARTDEFEELKKKRWGGLELDVGSIVERGIFGIDIPPSPVNQSNMAAEFEDQVRAHFLAGMDKSEAIEKATTLVGRNWKDQEFMGRSEAFKYPLMDYYAVEGSIKYAERQLIKDVREGLIFADQPEKEEIFLLSDKRTAEEAALGNPSYLIYIRQGGLITQTGQRFRPDVAEATQARDKRLRAKRKADAISVVERLPEMKAL